MRMDIHVHHHFDSLPSERVPAWGTAILEAIGTINQQLARIQTEEHTIMVKVTDIQAKADSTLAQVQAETDVINAVKLVVDHSNEQIATLKQQLADAIAAGVDPTSLQALSDTLDAIQAANTANTAKVAEAVAAGTPADAGGTVVPPTPDA